jgi:hypothetical protein
MDAEGSTSAVLVPAWWYQVIIDGEIGWAAWYGKGKPPEGAVPANPDGSMPPSTGSGGSTSDGGAAPQGGGPSAGPGDSSAGGAGPRGGGAWSETIPGGGAVGASIWRTVGATISAGWMKATQPIRVFSASMRDDG